MADGVVGTVPEGISNQVRNLDVASICDRLVYMGTEVLADPSIRLQETTSHTIRRVRSWLDRLDAFVAAIAKPVDPLDFVASDPLVMQVFDFPLGSMANVENRNLLDILRRLLKLYYEVLGSQSKDRTTGLNVHDLERYHSLVANLREMINFIEAQPAVDYPETPEGVMGAMAPGVLSPGR